ncbi:DUF4097 family beta strand repeat-containing protein [Roseivirga echinicomitans]|uniref:Uncharacterized protein n=1 Tax=Roseivirga echinicomitans TaxID=296218 RepID=A0A150X3P9_9BACT|nr:DUF4097 family beta strand repeat-containing protein [Roseivirga echinicomitans]KYG73212.1 hypothetical protein AWN68_11055 [Roseivirga echinicomitans]
MMKKLTKNLLAIALFLVAFTVQGQDFKVAISGQKKVVIKEVNRVSVEAYDGTEIQITSSNKDEERSERAVGLKSLSARGEDNTGIGLSVKTDGGQITIVQVARRADGKYTIKVPKSMNVKIEHTGNWEGGKMEVYGISGELEISGNYNNVYLEGITGPALVNTVYGGVEAKFSSLSQAGPTSLVSVYGDVDVTLPANAKANISAKTPYGEAYSDLSIEFPKTDGMRKVSSTVEGTLNGGGVKLDIQASFNNVYLRKK